MTAYAGNGGASASRKPALASNTHGVKKHRTATSNSSAITEFSSSSAGR